MTLHGCRIQPLEGDAQCLPWLRWALNAAPGPPETHELQYMLAHMDDGVVWGHYELPRRRWRIAAEIWPHEFPTLDRASLLQMRLFGEGAEVMVWRVEEMLAGRILVDGDVPDPACRPADASSWLAGDDVVETRDGFARLSAAGGLDQAIPVEGMGGGTRRMVGASLLMRRYFEEDDTTGALRVALTRLRGLEVR